MKVKVHTILALKEVLGKREIEISLPEGGTLESLLSQMTEKWGERLSSLLFEQGTARLLPRIRVMVNGRDAGFLQGTSTALKDGDEVTIFPPVSGG